MLYCSRNVSKIQWRCRILLAADRAGLYVLLNPIILPRTPSQPPHSTVFADTKASEQPNILHMDLNTAPRITEKGRAAALQMEQQIDNICCSLPPIVVRDIASLPPYDFTPTLVKLAKRLAPILAGLPLESHTEFWILFDRILGIWEGLPHIVNGQQCSGQERREVGLNFPTFTLSVHY